MRKKSDTHLFRELRQNTVVVGLALVIIYFVASFTDSWGQNWIRMIILFAGLLLLVFGHQKYLQEHSKTKIALIWILVILLLLGLVFLFLR